MRFLYIMLACVWLVFSWVCFDALRWQPPFPPPWHAEEALNESNTVNLEAEIEKITYFLENEEIRYHMPKRERARFHFNRARFYWLLSYHQNSRKAQMAYLQRALKDCLSTVELLPDDPIYLYSVADIYHQMKEYEQAEEYYKKSLAIEPNEGIVRRRYQELQEEMGKESTMSKQIMQDENSS